MKIVIFDDNPDDRNELIEIIRSWSHESNCNDLIIYPFDRIEALKFSLPDYLFSDIFFLDIMTPDSANAGFVLAEKIHVSNPDANIIFTTNSTEYWENAFEIFALHYLMKPISKVKIFRILNYIYLSPSRRNTRTTVLPGKDEKNFIVEYDRIIYVEAFTVLHTATVHLTDMTQKIISLNSIPFSRLIEGYLSEDFVQCHRSFIININYLMTYDRHCLSLKGYDSQIPIGKNYRENLTNKIIDHQKGLRAQELDLI